jgi:hypothetical protein
MDEKRSCGAMKREVVGPSCGAMIREVVGPWMRRKVVGL